MFAASFLVTGNWVRRASWPVAGIEVALDHVTLSFWFPGKPITVYFSDIKKVFIKKNGYTQFVTADEKTSFGVLVPGRTSKLIDALEGIGFDKNKIDKQNAEFSQKFSIVWLSVAFVIVIIYLYVLLKALL